ncbi:MAG: serine/threonine-protein kinase [Planctomycetota bacterium]
MTTHERFESLTLEDRDRLTRLLSTFETGWTPKTFGRFTKDLLSENAPEFREAALTALVAADLRISWASGKRRQLEAYLKSVPLLGTPESVSPDLILDEFLARRAVATSTSIDDFRDRFPGQYPRLLELIEPASHSSDVRQTMDLQFGERAAETTQDSSTQPQNGSTHASRGDIRTSKRLGRYQTMKVVGSGAMGTVYLAHDTQLDRQVALKTPRFDGDETASAIQRFYREARAAAKLQHRNICPVYDVGEIDGQHFISMAFIPGRCMSECVRASSLLSTREAAQIVLKLARALSFAHARSVVHRDLKPANIMIDQEGEPVVMDFGLARQMDSRTEITSVGVVHGTPAYMAPELVRGAESAVGPQADIYALGVTLYELLSGQLPFQGSMTQLLYQIVHTEAEPPSTHRDSIDSDLDDICLGMMVKDVGSRFQTMDEVATALMEYLRDNHGDPLSADAMDGALPTTASPLRVRPTSGPSIEIVTAPKTKRRRRRRRSRLLVATALVVGLGLAFRLRPSENRVLPTEDQKEGKLGTNPLDSSHPIAWGTPRSLGFFFEESKNLATELGDEFLEVYMHSYDGVIGTALATGVGQTDIWKFTRRASDEAWREKQNLGRSINTEQNELGPDISDSGLEVMFSSDRRRKKGGQLGLFLSTRKTTDADWGLATNLGPNVNSENRDAFPQFAENDLAVYFASSRRITGNMDLFVMHREAIGAAWSKPVNLGRRINTMASETSPLVSGDGLTLFFGSAAKQGAATDIKVSVRASREEPWQQPRRLGPHINTQEGELPFLISDDGKLFLFHRMKKLRNGSIRVETWVCHRLVESERLIDGGD